jgi:hypothetical protein
VSDVDAGQMPADDFAAQLEAELAEAQRKVYERHRDKIEAERDAVLADLVKLRMRSDQVIRVLRTLKLPVPDELVNLSAYGALADAQKWPTTPAAAAQPEPAQPPVQPTPAPPPATEPAPAPDREPVQPQEPASPQTPPAPARPASGRGAVAHPGPEALPPELRTMPSAAKNAPVAVREQVCREELAVVERLQQEPATPPELAKALGVPVARIGDRVRALWAAGMITLTGDQRGGAAEWRFNDDETPYGLHGDLLRMPAAAAQKPDQAPDATVVLLAMQQHQVLTAVRRIGKPVVNAELEGVVRMPRARLTDALNALADQGEFIERTGKRRWAKGQTAGRQAIEYRALHAEVPASTAAAVSHAKQEEAVRAAQAGEPVPVNPAHLAKVRDWVCKQKKPFKVAQVQEACGLPEGVVRACFQALLERSALAYVGIDDLELYEFRKPTDPGAAAKHDAARKAGGNGGSHPAATEVAGTGRGIRTGHQATDALVRRARNAGATVEQAGSGHIAIINPANGKRTIISKTPSGAPVMQEKRIKDIGLDI